MPNAVYICPNWILLLSQSNKCTSHHAECSTYFPLTAFPLENIGTLLSRALDASRDNQLRILRYRCWMAGRVQFAEEWMHLCCMFLGEPSLPLLSASVIQAAFAFVSYCVLILYNINCMYYYVLLYFSAENKMVAAQSCLYLFSLRCMPGFPGSFSFRAPCFHKKTLEHDMTRWGGLSVIALKDFDHLVNESWIATFEISPFRDMLGRSWQWTFLYSCWTIQECALISNRERNKASQQSNMGFGGKGNQHLWFATCIRMSQRVVATVRTQIFVNYWSPCLAASWTEESSPRMYMYSRAGKSPSIKLNQSALVFFSHPLDDRRTAWMQSHACCLCSGWYPGLGVCMIYRHAVVLQYKIQREDSAWRSQKL